MSASLVGSEMCIRDSDRSRPRGSCCWPKWGWGGSWGMSICFVRCGDSVSYTHLTLPTICSV
eukprot:4128509-Alexandrium_andersonii.AAC.1